MTPRPVHSFMEHSVCQSQNVQQIQCFLRFCFTSCNFTCSVAVRYWTPLYTDEHENVRETVIPLLLQNDLIAFLESAGYLGCGAI
jgi:hypothetical protein